jgi:hypothetical protein
MTAWCARAGAALVAGALAVVGGGCGGQDAGPTTTAAPATTQAPATSEQPTKPVVLRRPGGGATLRALARGTAAARISVPIAGSAAPGQTLLITASCAQRACRKFLLSDDLGEFTTTLALALKGSPSRLTVRVDYGAAPSAATQAKTTVRLRIRRAAARPTTATRSPAGKDEEPATTSSAPDDAEPLPRPQSAPGTTARRRLVVVGDSLAVGMRPYLAADLPGWEVSVDGRVGRPLAEGMGVLAGTAIPDPSRTVLGISLFTNDDPTRTAVLRSAIATSLSRAGADGCVVWATIARPAVGGVTYAAANRIIAQAAAGDDRLRVVPWAAYADAHAGILAADGVHPSPAGYRARASLYAEAAASCD